MVAFKWHNTTLYFEQEYVCVCVCAVSYTHLDVYKRQVMARGPPELGALGDR